MADSIFVRIQNVLSAGADSTVSVVERASGTSLMREAIRQVARAEDDARECLETAKARRLHAQRRQQALADQVATLGEQARFALSKDRPDLAEAAIARQIDCEAQAKQVAAAEQEAVAEAARLEEGLTALRARKTDMQKELAAFEAARNASAGGENSPAPDRVARQVSRAETLFERAMAAAGGGDLGLTPAGDAARIAEIEAMRRDAAVAERLAALRAGPAGS
ncbi:MAG TPA: PspA/IM30 family protein [Allosphingosinicella sp.]|jgi:phage shock protein A